MYVTCTRFHAERIRALYTASSLAPWKDPARTAVADEPAGA